MVYSNKTLNEINDALKTGQYISIDYPLEINEGEEAACWVYVFEGGSMLVAEYQVTLTHEEIVNYLGHD